MARFLSRNYSFSFFVSFIRTQRGNGMFSFQQLLLDSLPTLPRFCYPVSTRVTHCAFIALQKFHTFDKSAEKIDGRVVPCPHVKACDFPGFVEHFFLKLSMTIFPLYGQATSRSIKKTTSCKKATELPG